MSVSVLPLLFSKRTAVIANSQFQLNALNSKLLKKIEVCLQGMEDLFSKLHFLRFCLTLVNFG
jgi:hypothetical protein